VVLKSHVQSFGGFVDELQVFSHQPKVVGVEDGVEVGAVLFESEIYKECIGKSVQRYGNGRFLI
jgi:hypothetical protein